jgi:hypothetical protein
MNPTTAPTGPDTDGDHTPKPENSREAAQTDAEFPSQVSSPATRTRVPVGLVTQPYLTACVH